MAFSFSKIKQRLGNSTSIFAIFTFLTKPFAKQLRHSNSIQLAIPKQPAKVSVIVPNYNYKDYLEARISSILNQTYPIYELIILDDASSDGSLSFIEKKLLPFIRDKNPNLKLKFIPNKTNSGKSISQWKKAIREINGDFFWIAEADDISDPNFLAVVMSKYQQDKDTVISFSNSAAINSKGFVLTYDFQNKSVDKIRAHRFKRDFIVGGKEIIKHEFAINCIIPNVSSAVFRFDKTIPFEKYLAESMAFTQCGDWYFYLKVLQHGKLAYSRPALNFFRIHQRSVTASSKKSRVITEEVKTIHSNLANQYRLSENIYLAMKKEESRLEHRSS